jgi:hypothetical protein
MSIKLLDCATAITTSKAVDVGDAVKDHNLLVKFRDIGVTACSALTVSLYGSITDDGFTGLNVKAALAIGSTKPRVATGAFTYRIADTHYSKSAVAAGTAMPAYVISVSKFGCINLWIDAAGTITYDAVSATQAYASAAAAIAANKAYIEPKKLQLRYSNCYLGYILIEMGAGGDFTGNTTNLDGTANTIYVDGSVDWYLIGEIAMDATELANQSGNEIYTSKPYKYVRAFLSAITGTTEVDVYYHPSKV